MHLKSCIWKLGLKKARQVMPMTLVKRQTAMWQQTARRRKLMMVKGNWFNDSFIHLLLQNISHLFNTRSRSCFTISKMETFECLHVVGRNPLPMSYVNPAFLRYDSAVCHACQMAASQLAVSEVRGHEYEKIWGSSFSFEISVRIFLNNISGDSMVCLQNIFLESSVVNPCWS